MRHSRNVALLALTIALVLGVAAIAHGATPPTLTAKKTQVTFPHSTLLLSNADTASVIMRRLAGASDWTTFALVGSGDATTAVVRPRSTAAYELVSDGVTSDPVTISVAAQLSKPNFQGPHRKGRKLWINGWISPAHKAGDVQLTFYHWEKVGTVTVTLKNHKTKTVGNWAWVQVGDAVTTALYPHNSQRSWWAYKFVPTKRGTWKVVVSHEDTAHVYSQASAKVFIKPRR